MDLKRKLQECEELADGVEAKITELVESRKVAKIEAARIRHLLRMDSLRTHVEEVKASPTDMYGRALRVAMLVDFALRSAGVDNLTFVLPIGEYDAESTNPDYYDHSAEPLSTTKAKEDFFVRATWSWGTQRDRVAKIRGDGSVQAVGITSLANDNVQAVGITSHSYDKVHTFNVLTEDPEKWMPILCNDAPQ